MKNEPIRVLHITEMLSAAGIESFIMNVYRNIDRERVQFDFLVLRNEKEFYDDEILELGGRKHFIHSNIKNTLLRVIDEAKKIEAFLKQNHYDIVHIHYTTPLRAYYLKAAKNAGVPIRIYHSHSAKVSGKSIFKRMVYKYCKNKINKYATDLFACSEAAAEWMYSKRVIKQNKVIIVHNGIDTQRFLFNEDIRNKVRNELQIQDKFVIINTGRFTEQKNQRFIIDIISALKEDGIAVKLLLLGEGPLKEECENKVNDRGLNDYVIFLGVKSNVQDYLFAADCFLMPSLYEGLPVAGIEAECSGLICIFSDNVSNEVKLSELVDFLSLNCSPREWAEQVVKKQMPKNRENAVNYIKTAGYDIHEVSANLIKFYMQKAKR